MAFDNLLFDNLILHNERITIIDYNSVEKVDPNSCCFNFFHRGYSYKLCRALFSKRYEFY